jgi:hypothetical protein
MLGEITMVLWIAAVGSGLVWHGWAATLAPVPEPVPARSHRYDAVPHMDA